MREPLIIGHRGASVVALENTMPAFEAAIAAGADGIEFDVRLSRDGVPVIIHDDTLSRTHGVRRRVAELTAQELRSFGVPGLRELFELMAGNGLLLCLEIKSREPELVELCCRIVREFGFEERVIVECFDLNILRYVDLRKAALFEPRMHSEQSVIDRSLAAGATVLALHHRMAKPSLVEKAKLAGLMVVVWTVDDPAWVRRARTMGIAALITNDPARMLEA
ncbi:MAG TPA: glycerophosphodiester phosphodiesterase [Pyrinomonadaceae bacterium]|nr:glycerophosphodiester phosphodiesterase [Pyrinomonadaceae bacterium]